MQKTLIFISTHIINNAVISEYKKMLKIENADCILAIDNTNLKIPFENRITEKEFFGIQVKCFFFDKDVHNEINLPWFTEKNHTNNFADIMWHNSDYRFYYVKKYFPDYDYYWQFEYDIYCNGDSYQPFFDKYSDRKEDLLILNFREEKHNGEWFWSYNRTDWLYKDKKIYGGFFPIVRLTAKAADFLYNQRLVHKDIFEKLENKTNSTWIFCELFIATEIINNGFTAYNMQEPQIRYLPEYDLNEERLFENPNNMLYHPIKGMFIERQNKLNTANEELKEEIKELKSEKKLLEKQNEELAANVELLINKNKKQKKKIKKLSVIKLNLFGIKISHKRKA